MLLLRAYTRFGEPLAELNKAFNISAGYSLNGGRNLTFDISRTDPKATATILHRHNLIIAWSDEVEPWCGYIVRRAWQPDAISVTCHPVAARLNQRRTQPMKLENQPAGSLFYHLINDANRREFTGIGVGSVFSGGPNYTMEFQAEGIYDKLGELMDLTKCEYTISLLYPGMWQADLYERVGRDLTDTVAIIGGIDTDGMPQYEEDDTEFANSILAVGKAGEGSGNNPSGPEAEWERRPKAEYTDWDSVGEEGLSEDVLDVSEVENVDTLMRMAHEEATTRARPRIPTSFNLNRKRLLWSKFTDGDIVCLQIPYYGFTGLAVPYRILGREINEEAGSMTIAGEVVEGERAQLLSMYANFHYGTDAGRIIPRKQTE